MLIWKCATKQLKIDNFSIQNILEIFFSNKEESTYYFMFLILGVYITIPVLSKLSDKCNRKLCWYTVITIFITQSTLPVIFKLFNITYNNSLSFEYYHLVAYNIWYNSPLIFLCTLNLFEIFTRINTDKLKTWIINIFTCISKISLSIYFIHIIVEMVLVNYIKVMKCSNPVKVLILFVISSIVTTLIALIYNTIKISVNRYFKQISTNKLKIKNNL